jgi:hypothetical protein
MNKIATLILVALAISGCSKTKEADIYSPKISAIENKIAKTAEEQVKINADFESRLSAQSKLIEEQKLLIEKNTRRIEESESSMLKLRAEESARMEILKQAKLDAEKKEALNADSLTGSIYLVKKSGDSSILRGQEIKIISKEDSRKLALAFENSDHTKKAKNFEDLFSNQPGQMARLYSISFDLALADYQPKIIAQTKSGIDGKYSIKGLPAGEYIIFSILNTSSNFGVWMVSVTVSGAAPQNVDLENSNMRYVY